MRLTRAWWLLHMQIYGPINAFRLYDPIKKQYKGGIDENLWDTVMLK